MALRGVLIGEGGTPFQKRRRKSVAVVVLGDIGRSPRMQYHAMSLVGEDEAVDVALIGYRGERCVPAVQGHRRVTQHFVDPVAGKALR